MNSGSEHNRRLIAALLASWSDPDPARFASLFVADGRFEDVPYGIRIIGTEALLAHAARVKKHNVDFEMTMLRCDATATTGVAEWQLAHEYVGRFDGIDCTGRPVRIRGLSIYEFRDGLIASATDYWNYMELVRTMEVIPREIRGFRAAG